MTKNQILAEVAKLSNQSNAMAGRVLDEVLEEIAGLLQRGESITFSGFGSFAVHHRRGRKGRNPQTGSEIHIQPHRVLRFRPGKKLLHTINHGHR
ncbi:MAG: HU family DNA-binding protein [Deltaproteobacteria bacterium]|nr:HU family DNA-binding protein [Deltaproteobacteria bacterium]